MAIYDDPVINGTYDTTKKNVLKSLHIIKDVVSIWLSLMEPWLVAQQLHSGILNGWRRWQNGHHWRDSMFNHLSTASDWWHR